MNKKFYLGLLAVSVLAGCKDSSSGGNDSSGGDGGDIGGGDKDIVRLEKVELNAPHGISAGHNRIYLPVGYPTQFQAIAHYSDTSEADVTDKAEWTTDDALELDSTLAGAVWAKESVLNNVRVSAIYEGESARNDVQAVDWEHDSFYIGGNQVVAKGIPAKLTANFSFPNSQAQTDLDVTQFVDWESSDANVAVVDNGTLTAFEAGNIEINAHFDSQTTNLYDSAEVLNVEVIELNGDVDLNLAIWAGLNPEKPEEGEDVLIVHDNIQTHLRANLTVSDQSGVVVPETNISGLVKWSTEGNCEVIAEGDNYFITADEASNDMYDCKVNATFEPAEAPESAQASLELTTLGQEHFRPLELKCNDTQSVKGDLTECPDSFVGELSLESVIPVAKANISSDIRVTGQATWASSNENVQVEQGKVTSDAAGQTATITAGLNGMEAEHNVTVGLPVDVEILIRTEFGKDDNNVLLPMIPVTLHAYYIGDDSEEVDVTAGATWTLTDNFNDDWKLNGNTIESLNNDYPTNITVSMEMEEFTAELPLDAQPLSVCLPSDDATSEFCVQVEDTADSEFTSSPNTNLATKAKVIGEGNAAGANFPGIQVRYNTGENDKNGSATSAWCAYLETIEFNGSTNGWKIPFTRNDFDVLDGLNEWPNGFAWTQTRTGTPQDGYVLHVNVTAAVNGPSDSRAKLFAVTNGAGAGSTNKNLVICQAN
ncbi:hypothetical protein VIN01S_22910 [Vibrio inusitatus NBRC 102082]|uniref:BIG2 domain-containing protein n=1 Tax=Vibrio inusitatus NBRC 102082 TaxID=1219070 RepID=A0A4Y3HWN8_9VIBR|nr:hypothetical protein [Vibrio inusitatus]GEA51487.1 hypothetical protein VIN01S_22910 [Vibrio inusitatus NBRC 102082]